jgi:peptide/nickel transport system substrate-binding protein
MTDRENADLWAAASTRRQLLVRLGAGGAALSLGGLLVACADDEGSTTTGGSPAKGADTQIDRITWALNSPIPSLDVATGRVIPGIAVMSLGLEGLVTVGDDRKVEPLLAESWDQPDPSTYVYKLREGVKFWDGSPLTVEDVVWSMSRHLDPKLASQIGNLWANAKSVEASGPNEVTVRMKQPDAMFPYVPALTFITPKALGEKLGKKLGTPGSEMTTMGTGPYELVSFNADTGLEVKRNAGYWGEQPRVKAASVKFIVDPQTLLLALRSGEVDGTFNLPADRSKAYDRLTTATTEWVPGAQTNYLSLDTSAEPWNDVHVRRMLAYATDKEGYIKAFLGGHARPALSMVPPENWTAVASQSEVDEIYSQLAQYPYDLDKAKDELSQSAYPDGFSATVQFPDTNPLNGKVLVSLSETLKGLGVTLKVREVPGAKWLADLYAHKNLGMQISGYGTVSVDPAYHLLPFFLSAGAKANGLNTANVKDERIDGLVQEQLESADKATRVKALTEILKYASEELPYVPLWWQEVGMAVNEKYVYEGFNASYFLTDWLSKVAARA